MNTLEQNIFDLAVPVARDLGYSIVDIKTFGKERITLQIFLEKVDFTSVSIDDCAKFSRSFAVVLDVNDLIEQRYTLEVSSAGVDRKIAKVEDFKRFIGSDIVIKTKLPIEGQKNFKGSLIQVEEDKLEIIVNGSNIFVPIEFIDKANLDLLKKILNNSEQEKIISIRKGIKRERMLNKNNSNELQARPELIDIIEAVSKDKGISIEDVFEAMETAIKKIAVNKYGNLYDIRVKINRNNGSILIQKVITVVEEIENPYHEVLLEEAKKNNPEIVLGDLLIDILPSVNFDRNFVQPFRQIVTRRVKEAEKEKEFDLYKDKIGEIVSGIVKRVELGNVFVELSNKAEAFMRRDNTIPRERLEVGDRIRALIVDVKEDIKSAQIILSRSHPDFVKKLFVQEISEVYEGQIEIMGIAREAGSRSKVALISNDPSIDPISTCVGFKGQRIQGVLSELKGEKIDLIRYSDNIGNFVFNAFHSSEVLKVIVDEDKKSIEVVVKPEKLRLAIGRGGQNINLISDLVGWHIDLMDEETEKTKRQTEMAERVEYIKKVLDVDDIISQLLVIEGFKTVEDVIEEKVASLSSIQAFNEEIIDELKTRAKDFISARDKKYKEEMDALKISDDLRNFEGLDKERIITLGKEGVKTVEDLAELSTYDLLDILPDRSIDFKKAEAIIVLARKSWEV